MFGSLVLWHRSPQTSLLLNLFLVSLSPEQLARRLQLSQRLLHSTLQHRMYLGMFLFVDDAGDELRSEHVLRLLPHEVFNYMPRIVFGGCYPFIGGLFVEVGAIGQFKLEGQPRFKDVALAL